MRIVHRGVTAATSSNRRRGQSQREGMAVGPLCIDWNTKLEDSEGGRSPPSRSGTLGETTFLRHLPQKNRDM